MKLDRRDVLKGLVVTAATAAVPLSNAATVRVQQWMPPVLHADNLARWCEAVAPMQQARWHYQQLTDGAGVIRYLPSRMAFWTVPERGSWWRKSAFRLFAKGEPLTEPRRYHVARAAAHIASRVSFLREEGESFIAWYAGSGPWHWTGVLDTHALDKNPAPPLVAQAGDPRHGDLWLYA